MKYVIVLVCEITGHIVVMIRNCDLGEGGGTSKSWLSEGSQRVGKGLYPHSFLAKVSSKLFLCDGY